MNEVPDYQVVITLVSISIPTSCTRDAPQLISTVNPVILFPPQ
jgi:hypothetical protein